MTEIDLVKDSTMQETNRILTLIAGKEGGFTPKSWKDVLCEDVLLSLQCRELEIFVFV